MQYIGIVYNCVICLGIKHYYNWKQWFCIGLWMGYTHKLILVSFLKGRRHLCQWLKDSWYVLSWMNISQPHMFWWWCVVLIIWDGILNLRSESLIWTSPFQSYVMEKPDEYFFRMSMWSSWNDIFKRIFWHNSIFVTSFLLSSFTWIK